MYDSLTTNLAHPVMAFATLAFPPSTPLFPKASVVFEYLKEYARKFDLMPHIHLNTSVESAVWTGTSWAIHLSTGQDLLYDRLIVANGRNRKPYYPPIPGLDHWISEKLVTHAVYYRTPTNVGDTVLVVGGGPSGNDISDAMQGFCKTLIRSLPAPGNLAEAGNVQTRAKVVRFSADDSRTVFFADGSHVSGIDHVFLATGYFLHYPFLSSLETSLPPPPSPLLPSRLHNSGSHLFPLARELFPLSAEFPPWSIAFLGLPLHASPFPMTEDQMRAVVRVFSDPDALDPIVESFIIRDRYEALTKKFDNASPEEIMQKWVYYSGKEEYEYRDALNAFAGYVGAKWTVPRWSYEFVDLDKRILLRRAWTELVASGEADAWIERVGEGGEQEWVDLMRRLCARATLERSEHVS